MSVRGDSGASWVHGDSTIQQGVASAARRLRLQRALRLLLLFLPVTLSAAAVFLAAGRTGLIPPCAHSGLLAGLLASVAFSAASLLLPGPGGEGLALLLDRRLGSRERIVTAWEAERRGGPRNEFERRVLEEAPAFLERRAAALPWRLPRRTSVLAPALGLVVLAAILPLPRFGERVRARGAETARAEARVRSAGAGLREGLRQLQAVRPQRSAIGIQPLLAEAARLAERMEKGKIARSAAQQGLERLEASLQRIALQQGDTGLRPGMQGAAEKLGGEPLTAEVGEALRSGDRDRLLRAFSAFGQKMRSEADVEKGRAKQAADAMGSLADALEAEAEELEKADPGDPENQEKARRLRQLAEGLRDLSQAMKNGDSAKARELLAGLQVELANNLASSCSRKSKDLEKQASHLLALAKVRLGMLAPPRLPPGGEGAIRVRGAGPDFGVGSTNEEQTGNLVGSPHAYDRQGDAQVERLGRYEEKYGSRLLGTSPDQEAQVRVNGVEGREETVSVSVTGPGLAGGASTETVPAEGPGGLGREEAVSIERIPPGYREMVRRYFERE